MSVWDRILIWGVREEEIDAAWPCDEHALPVEMSCYRGIDVWAEPEHVFRWLCQLKIAPYSYDWIDHWGRQSPRQLTPGADSLAVGQRFMNIFDLVGFVPRRSVTLRTRGSAPFGRIIVSYQALEQPGGTRLVVRLRLPDSSRPLHRFARSALILGDWVMMRKQLLTLKSLAEASRSQDGRL